MMAPQFKRVCEHTSNAIKSEREEMGAAESFVVMARQGPATRIEECTHAPFDN